MTVRAAWPAVFVLLVSGCFSPAGPDASLGDHLPEQGLVAAHVEAQCRPCGPAWGFAEPQLRATLFYEDGRVLRAALNVAEANATVVVAPGVPWDGRALEALAPVIVETFGNDGDEGLWVAWVEPATATEPTFGALLAALNASWEGPADPKPSQGCPGCPGAGVYFRVGGDGRLEELRGRNLGPGDDAKSPFARLAQAFSEAEMRAEPVELGAPEPRDVRLVRITESIQVTSPEGTHLPADFGPHCTPFAREGGGEDEIRLRQAFWKPVQAALVAREFPGDQRQGSFLTMSSDGDDLVEDASGEGDYYVLSPFDRARVVATITVRGAAVAVDGGDVPEGEARTFTREYEVEHEGKMHQVRETLTVENVGERRLRIVESGLCM